MIYLLPGTSQHLIRKDALCIFLGLGKAAWDTIMKMAKANIPPEHGLAGKAGNKHKNEMEAALKVFFERMILQAVPRASLLVETWFAKGM